MSAGNFPACLATLKTEEGGYVNNPHDPGGATNFGVTQAVYDAWRRSQGFAFQSVRYITQTEVSAIYRLQYWNPIRGDDLYAGLDMMMLNIAAMDGPVKAVKILQEALEVPMDGMFGLHTMGALSAITDRAGFIGTVCGDEMGFLRTLRTWVYFGVGWNNRYVALKPQALAMLAKA